MWVYRSSVFARTVSRRATIREVRAQAITRGRGLLTANGRRSGTRSTREGAYGSKWAVRDIIGFALDMRTAGNGSFAAPNGVAFTAIDAPYLSPSFTCDGSYRVNFGDRPFSHAPPDAGYVSVHLFHLQQPNRP